MVRWILIVTMMNVIVIASLGMVALELAAACSAASLDDDDVLCSFWILRLSIRILAV